MSRAASRTVPSVIPSTRIRGQNGRPLNADGDYILYWMTTARRTRYNFGLQRAVDLCVEHRKPLLIFEALRVDYPHACDRFHAFVLDGMRTNAAAARRAGVTYVPYVERRPGEGSGLLCALAQRAVAIVTDWFPAFFLPRMLAAAAARCPVALEAIDGNGLIPVEDQGRAFPTPRGYRAFVQRTLRQHLAAFPEEDPLRRAPALPITLSHDVVTRWPAADLDDTRVVSSLPINHAIAPTYAGGQDVATQRLDRFVHEGLARYDSEGNDPDADCTSHLSPYLHFGQISAHEIFSTVMSSLRWTTRRIAKVRAGAREGWWGVSPAAEHFLDQIVVWRELAFNGCAWTPGFARYDTLPVWARATLEAHREDERPHLYTLEELDGARTHDPLWNAAQRQLRDEGWFHGYMRMLWGKKILEWCREPSDALDRMEALMNRYSLDGRDPVSYLNYGWVLGRYDRPWPERPVFGTVRAMTSASAMRKLKVKKYLAKYGSDPEQRDRSRLF